MECGRTLARTLKASGVDVVVACTHMRLPNDMLLADTVPEIDLVLAGHDHDYLVCIYGAAVLTDLVLPLCPDAHFNQTVRCTMTTYMPMDDR